MLSIRVGQHQGGQSGASQAAGANFQLAGTTWSYQGAQNLINFSAVQDKPIGNLLLGWGDMTFEGCNEHLTGTLGATPPQNGIGSVMKLNGSMVDGMLRMQATSYVYCACEETSGSTVTSNP